ncbi:MAG: gliding motility lipoprotein GldB [Flavobacteriaceae bacterium]|nr:gliding motility lipoprotein GldB [Flavobacteriaceae bacterium]
MFFSLVIALGACTSSKHPKQNQLPEISFELVRFEQQFFGNIDTPFDSVKAKFPYFFPLKTPDSLWQNKRVDSLQQALYQATKPLFDGELLSRVEDVFKHAKYYFPSEQLPSRVITLLTDVDYTLRAVDADSLLLISIDTYLGADHPLYEGIPQYIRKTLQPAHLEAELIDALSSRFVPKSIERTFLAQCIVAGKQLMLHDYLAPKALPIHHIQYTQEQWDWAVAHEEDVWRYFVENELLFSTDDVLIFRFLKPSPFSKFYSYLEDGSPGRIGAWIGYRIVQAYQKRTNATLQEALLENTQEILKKSRYNP